MARVRVVLVRPDSAVNVGATARVVRNYDLRGLDLAIDAQVAALRTVDDDALGRPTIARALMAAGHATSVEDAFRRLLGLAGPKLVLPQDHLVATALDPAAENKVVAGPENEIRVEMDAETGEPRPYLHVRRGLEALIARPVFYELVELAKERETPQGPTLGVSSNGAWFPVGPAGAHRL